MSIARTLDSLRQAFPECRTVAYADISTSMILSTSSDDALRQEHLDALCETAVDMLDGTGAPPLADLLGKGDGGVFQVIVMDPAEVGIFLKSTTTPTDALCCLCSPRIDTGSFIPHARRYLEEIGVDG